LLALTLASSFGTVAQTGGGPKAVGAGPSHNEMAVAGRIFGFVVFGFIDDPQGALVPYSNLTLINSATQARQETSSDQQGYFEFGSLEPGNYRWKKQYFGLEVDRVRRFKQLQEENIRLKQLLADLTAEKAMLQDVLSRKF